MSFRSRPAALAALVVALVASYVVAAVAASGPAAADGTVTVTIVGKGTVTGDGISCSEPGGGGADCNEFYPDDDETCTEPPHPICTENPQTVELVAEPDRNGYTFQGFTGCTSDLGRTCTVFVNVSKNVTATFADVVAPSVALTSPPSGVVHGTISLGATANDNVAVHRVEFFLGVAEVGEDGQPPYGITFNTNEMPDGPVLLVARAIDTSGNETMSASRPLTIDNTAPTLSVTGPDGATFGPGSTQTWTITASDQTTGPPSVQCSVVAVGSPASFAACSGGASAHSVTGKPEGSYEFRAKATDGAGNTTEAAPRTFTIDATPPDTSMTSGPAEGEVVDNGTVTFGLGATEAGSTFGCRLYPTGTTAPSFAPCTTATSFTASGLADGAYTFQARASDGVGNTDPTPATRAFTVDTTPPDTSVVSGPVNGGVVNVRTVTYGLGGSEAVATMACRLYRSGTTAPAFAACTTPTSFTASGLDDGSYLFEARATDVAGHTDATPVSRTFVVDATPPTVSITKAPKRIVKTSKKKVKVAFGFAANDPGATFRCSLDGAAYAACPAGLSLKVKIGKHTLSVMAVDAAGNVSPTLATSWKVKRVKKHH